MDVLATTLNYPLRPNLHSKRKYSPKRPICSSKKEEATGLTQKNWPSISLSLFGSGFFLGPLLDGIHSRVNLVSYENGSIEIGPLHTNIWVPLLLGTFYLSVGMLQLILEERVGSRSKLPGGSLQRTAVALVTLVLFLEVSAEMYKAGVPANIEAYTLFALGEAIWLFLDGTWWGFTLACLVGFLCPLAEIPIVKWFHLWNYPDANIQLFGEGLVTWTTICYFVYTPFLINLARWLRESLADKEAKQV